jgi:hypothetical protein
MPRLNGHVSSLKNWVTLCLLVWMLVACSKGAREGRIPHEISTMSPSVATVLGESKPASIEDLPVPAIATRDAEHPDETSDAYTAAGVTLKQLKEWYQKELPLNTPWMDWTWCRSEPSGVGDALDRVWYRPGTNQELGLTIGEDPPGTSFILIIKDDSGPCHNPEPQKSG